MDFALRSLRVTEVLRRTACGGVLATQLTRSATSVAANYRAALRGKSAADFINKVTIVLEEADETEFWLELAVRSGLVDAQRVQGLRQEALELVRIFSATRRTALRRHRARSQAKDVPPNHKS